MGGFEGGDEGGFWEEVKPPHSANRDNLSQKSYSNLTDGIYTTHAHAKVNIFLKITGHKEGYHTLLSRFMRVENVYDTIRFVPQKCDSFTIEGCEGIPLESNTIYKAYIALNDATGDLDILNFFYTHKVVVEKRIPSQAGLGGGSSDGAAFMRLVKSACNLMITTEELARIGSTIGADFPFFIYDYPSANVSGFGEVVEPFHELPLELEVFTPPVGCDTTEVYKTFKKSFLEHIDTTTFKGWETLESKELLARVSEPKMLNDLYRAALLAYPKLETYQKEGWFFSGSGSTFFKPL